MIVFLTIRSIAILRKYRPTSFVSFLLISFSLLLCCYGLVFCNKILAVPKLSTPDQKTFITRSGSSLMLGGNKFRFSGPNIYWLALLERPEGIVYPSQFEVDDAMTTAAEMGATVVRSLTL